MTRNSLIRNIMMAMVSINIASCATSPGGNVYSRQETGVPTTLTPGTLMSVESVIIQGDTIGIGGVAGAAIGGLAGSDVGGSEEENTIGAVAGAVLGGLAGNAIEASMKRQQGYRYVVNLDNGKHIIVVQADPQPIATPGSRILVTYGARTKIIPAD